MEAVRVQYSRSFGGYLLQTSGLLRASRLKRTRQGEKTVWQGRKKSFPRLKKRPAGLKKRFPGLKKSFEVEKKLSRVEKKLFPFDDHIFQMGGKKPPAINYITYLESI